MAELEQFTPGFRLVDGAQLNTVVDEVNNLTGNGTAGPVAASTITASGAANVAGTLTVGTQVAAAAGSNSQSNSTLITKSQVIVTTVSATTRGVRMPAAATGLRVLIINAGGTNNKVYPATGDRFNAGSTNAAVTITKSKAVEYVAQDAQTWRALAGA